MNLFLVVIARLNPGTTIELVVIIAIRTVIRFSNVLCSIITIPLGRFKLVTTVTVSLNFKPVKPPTIVSIVVLPSNVNPATGDV